MIGRCPAGSARAKTFGGAGILPAKLRASHAGWKLPEENSASCFSGGAFEIPGYPVDFVVEGLYSREAFVHDGGELFGASALRGLGDALVGREGVVV